MIFQKIERMIENRLGTGVAAIAEKSDLSRARISDKRRGVPPGVRAHNTSARTGAWRVVTILVVLAVALSMVAPIAAASTATATSSGPPSGMVGVPSGNVGPPDHAKGNGPNAKQLPSNIPTHAAAWDVMSNKHAGTLEVTVDATSDGDLVLQASDDINHAGRTIAVDAQTLAQAVGHRPSTAHGLHSSGESWVDEIEYEDGYAKFSPPKFSTNTITFDGTVTLSGTDVANGTAWTYELQDASGVDDGQINLTGVNRTNAASLNETVYSSRDVTVDVGGSQSPTADLWVNASRARYSMEHVDDQSGVKTKTFDNPPETIENVTADLENLHSSDSGTVNLSIKAANGTVIWSKNPSISPESTKTVEYSPNLDVSGEENITLYNDKFAFARVHDFTAISSAPGTVTVESGTDSASFGEADYGTTKNYDLGTGSNALNVTANDGEIDVGLEWTESVETTDPKVTINGEPAGSVSGTLSAGQTETIDLDTSLLKDGNNTVTVETGSVNSLMSWTDFSLNHSAAVNQSVSYEAEAWSERYNVSRTWDSATTDASVTIPFASSRVVAVRSVEYRVNGGSWSSLETYSMDGTTLTAQLGDVSEGDTIDVRANGTKVRVENGAITVLDPTVAGNSLDTAVEITNHSSSFGIGVGGTSEGKWVHKTANESWTAPETFVTIDASGGQTIRAPGASAGSTMNVRTVPLEVTPDAGQLNLTLKESSKELTFDVEPTSSVSEVTYRYHDTISGERYVLYSETHGVARDSEIAQSPVSLLGGSYTETLSIILDSGSSSSSGTSGGGGFGGAIGPTSSANPLLVLVIGVAAIAGTAYVARRTGVPMSVVGGTGLLVAILGIETISPGTISDGVRSAIVLLSSQLGPVMPLIALILVGTGAYMAVRWWQGRTGPDTQVTLQLNGGNK